MTGFQAGFASSGGTSDGTSSLFQLDVVVFAVTAALLIAFAVFVVVVLRSEEPVPVGPRTLTTPPQSPAVAALLTHTREVPGEAVAATVVDLAARGVLEIVDLGGGTTGVRIRGTSPPSLTAYESSVYQLVAAHVDADGIAPAAELAFAGDKTAKAWLKKFRDDVRREARSSGWVRSRYGREVAMLAVAVLVIGLLVVIWGEATATRYPSEASVSDYPHGDLRGGLTFLALVLGVGDLGMLFKLGTSPSQTLTASGRVLASQWRGVAEHLHEDRELERAPVAAVAIWHRLLAYAAAFGAARTVQQSLPLGPMSPTRAWSSQTGHWRQVDVDYPRFWPAGWGRLPIELARQGGSLLAQSIVPSIVIGAVLSALISQAVLSDGRLPLAVFLFGGLMVAAFGGMLLFGLWQIGVACYLAIVRGGDVLRIAGTVVRVVTADRWTWIAIDDGSSNRLRAYVSRIGCSVSQGDRAVMMARRADGLVTSIEPMSQAVKAATTDPSGYFAR